jgi:hypothetical protein
MKNNIETLDEAVDALLMSLDDARKRELRELVPNPREEKARNWMDEVVAIFGLDKLGSKLSNDIERHFPDESVFKGPVFDNANGIFEAEILLREAREVLMGKKSFPKDSSLP